MKRLLATDDAWALAVARLALGVVMFLPSARAASRTGTAVALVNLQP